MNILRAVRRRCIGLVVILWLALAAMPSAAAPLLQSSGKLDCTFTADYTVVVLRGGPGRSYAIEGSLRDGETLQVIGQQAGNDGYVWWESEAGTWVRSDLGDSDCPATCGNTVCEYGETASTCAKDCRTHNTTLRSTGTGCLVEDSQACYESIACYPGCSDCDCWLNDYGCVTCSCDYPGQGDKSSSATTAAGATGCEFASCEACIAAFPCYSGACSYTACELNDYGCPVCETAP